MKKHKERWREEELAYISYRCGQIPYAQFLEGLYQLQLSLGIQPRTINAIRIKIARMGIQFEVCNWESAIPVRELLAATGKNRSTLKTWKRHGLPVRGLTSSKPQYWQYVWLSEFRAWAKANPRFLSGVPSDALRWLIGDDEIINLIAGSSQLIKTKPKPVRCINNGVVYASISSAAASNFLTAQAVSQALRRGRPCAGMTFEYASN